MALPMHSENCAPNDGNPASVTDEPVPPVFASPEADEPHGGAARSLPSAAQTGSADSSGTVSSYKWSASSDSESHAKGGSSSNSNGERHLIRKTRRPRKATYTVRKEETDRLAKEAETLESRMRVLVERAQERLTDGELLNAILNDTRCDQQLSFAIAQSVVSGFLNGEDSNPLHMSIHLGTDWEERRNALIGLRDSKLQNAFEYVQARSKFLDPLKPHHSEERVETLNGNYCCARFDLTQFEGVESVKQVFDTLMLYNLNIEISVSERMGHITVREDYDNVDQSLLNCRLLSTECGVNIESHIVTFAKFYERHEVSNGQPCDIVVLDFVDEDELHPYTSNERVRKDVAQVVVLTPHMRKKSDGEEKLVVVIVRGKFLRLHSAEFEVSPLAVQGMRSSMCWGPVMVMTINELLHLEFFSPITEGSNLCALSV